MAGERKFQHVKSRSMPELWKRAPEQGTESRVLENPEQKASSLPPTATFAEKFDCQKFKNKLDPKPELIKKGMIKSALADYDHAMLKICLDSAKYHDLYIDSYNEFYKANKLRRN